MGCSDWLDRRRQAPAAGLRRVGQRHHAGDTERALGQGPGLVEDDGSILRARSKAARSRISRPFWAVRLVLTATTSGTARPRAWGQVMTITVTMRSSANAKLSPRASQTAKVAAPDAKRDVGQPERGTVGDVLGAGAGRLGPLHHVDDLGEVGLVAGLGDLDGQGALAVDRAADDVAAVALVDRPRFAGQHGFVEARSACAMIAVDRHPLARPDQDAVAGFELAHRHVLRLAVRPKRCAVAGSSRTSASSAPEAPSTDRISIQ